MADAHKNFAYSTVATAPSPASSGTSLVVQSGDGTKFPAVPFNASIWPAGVRPLTTNAEIVRVTAISTDTFTITRTQEGTSARSVIVGDQIAATITNKTLLDAEENVEISVTQASHGFAVGDVIRLDGTSYVKAKADLAANAEVVGIVSVVVTTGIFRMITGGRITGLSSLTAGTVYFLSASTAGALTATEPTTIGHVSKPLLVADSTTSGYFFNYRGYIIGADGGGEPAGASVYRNGTFSHNSSGSWLQVGMDTEVIDTHSYHDNSTNNSRLTVPVGLSGKYLAIGAAWWDANATGNRFTRIILNGATELAMTSDPGTTGVLRQQTMWYGDLNNGDYIELGTYQDSGGTRTVGDATNDAALFIQMFRIGGAPTPGVGQTDGWTLDDASTWTYASSTTFTISGDHTSKFTRGTRLKLTQTTVKYFVVVSSSFSAGTTTVTLTGGNDYTFANAAVTNNYYSYDANPQGYPGWFTYTPVLTAATTNPTLGSGSIQSGRFSVVGQTVTVRIKIHFGTSGTDAGSGVYYISIPIDGLSADASDFILGNGMIYDSSLGNGKVVYSYWNGSDRTKLQLFLDGTTGLVRHDQPWAWAASDQLNAMVIY